MPAWREWGRLWGRLRATAAPFVAIGGGEMASAHGDGYTVLALEAAATRSRSYAGWLTVGGSSTGVSTTSSINW